MLGARSGVRDVSPAGCVYTVPGPPSQLITAPRGGLEKIVKVAIGSHVGRLSRVSSVTLLDKYGNKGYLGEGRYCYRRRLGERRV